jgi:hypothetical protein
MAGSYRHLVDNDNRLHDKDYSLIENLGDAKECIEELFAMIQWLTNGDKRRIHEAWLKGYAEPKLPPDNAPHFTYEQFWY